MRSKSLATVVDLMGIPIYRLQGGIKRIAIKLLTFFKQTSLSGCGTSWKYRGWKNRIF